MCFNQIYFERTTGSAFVGQRVKWLTRLIRSLRDRVGEGLVWDLGAEEM